MTVASGSALTGLTLTVELAQDGASLPEVAVSLESSVVRRALESALSGGPAHDTRLGLRLSRPLPDRAELQARLGPEVLASLGNQATSLEASFGSQLENAFGEIEIAVDLRVSPDRPWREVLELRVPIDAPPAVARVYRAILDDLEAIHTGLARDLASRHSHRSSSMGARVFQPGLELEILEDSLVKLSGALRRIALQPSTVLARESVFRRWRAGDRTDHRSVAFLARDPDVEWRGRRPERVGRMPIYETILSVDIEEHRHISAGIVELSRRSRALARGCYRAASLLRDEEERWGGASTGVYAQRYRPRVDRLDSLGARADRLAEEFAALLREPPLSVAGDRPRTVFGPTPIFVNRPGYREAYQVLRDVVRRPAAMVDVQQLRMRHRHLDVLYEYWVYAKVLATCRDLLGPITSGSGFEMYDEIYRPDLAPGQQAVWHVGSQRVRLFYEPDIPPMDTDYTQSELPWRASLVSSPLRPDIVLLVESEEERPRALVLDAKNTTRLPLERLFSISDYRTLISDPETGWQPVRQLFLVHRDPGRALVSSYPGYERGKDPPVEVSVLGAVLLAPGEDERLRGVVERFLRLE